MKYLLDTNVWVDIERENDTGLVDRFRNTSTQDMCLSTIVLGELLVGAERSADPTRAITLLDTLTYGVKRVGIDETCARIFAQIHADLLSHGLRIGMNDTWIAAQAISCDLTLVTANTREFERVEGLTVENWRS